MVLQYPDKHYKKVFVTAPSSPSPCTAVQHERRVDSPGPDYSQPLEQLRSSTREERRTNGPKARSSNSAESSTKAIILDHPRRHAQPSLVVVHAKRGCCFLAKIALVLTYSKSRRYTLNVSGRHVPTLQLEIRKVGLRTVPAANVISNHIRITVQYIWEQ